MQLDTTAESMYIQRNSPLAKHPEHNMNSKLKNLKTPGSDHYPYPNHPSSECGDYNHAMTADFWYTHNSDVVTKRELHNIHECSFTDYPMYKDLKTPVANAENGVYLLPLTGARFEPIDSVTKSSPKKGIFKNLKAALFAKKNVKHPKVKQTLHLPVVNLSTEYNRPVFNRALTVNNLRSAYSLDCLNVIENTIVWRELSNQKGLTLKDKHVERVYPNSRIRHHSGSDILTDVLRNNEINDNLTHENLMQRVKTQPEKAKTIKQNGLPVFMHTQKDIGNMSESQGDIIFGEESVDSVQEDQRVPFHYTKRQNKNIVPRYFKQQLQPPHGVTGKYTENIGSNITLSKLKNSLSSSTSSARSSASSAQMQDERNFLSLSSLTLNSSPSQQDMLDRHFRTLGRNPPQRRYLQPQNDRWGQQHTDLNHCLTGSGVSIESSDSGLGSYSDSYLAKVKRSVHFNGSDEVFEYIPVNSGVCRQQQRLRQGTVAAKNRARKPKMATYL